MRGLHCLVVGVPASIKVSAESPDPLDLHTGLYVYVYAEDSQQGGTEAMMASRRSRDPESWSHLDNLLEHGETLSRMALPFGADGQVCELLRLISCCELAEGVVPGFGPVSCSCPSHLVFFGEADPERVVDMLVERVSLMMGVYPASMTLPDSD